MRRRTSLSRKRPLGAGRKSLKPRSDRAKTLQYLHELWREVVYRRDGFSCQVTGKQTGLNPHHVYPKHGFPSLRFDPDNGITLNMGAHMNWHDERHIGEMTPRDWWTKKYPERAARLAIISRTPRKTDLALTEIYLRKLLEGK